MCYGHQIVPALGRRRLVRVFAMETATDTNPVSNGLMANGLMVSHFRTRLAQIELTFANTRASVAAAAAAAAR